MVIVCGGVTNRSYDEIGGVWKIATVVVFNPYSIFLLIGVKGPREGDVYG